MPDLDAEADAPPLQADPVVDELQRLAPELVVAGGSFVLPHPRDVPPPHRQRVLAAARSRGTRKCLIDLVAGVGLPAVEPARLSSGAREWPGGWTGSVSHKGKTVVAAIVPSDRQAAIGVDIERLDGKVIPPRPGLDAAAQPWSVSDDAGRTIVFSVKEAVYKALNPALGCPLDFADVALSWSPPGSSARAHGVARACGVTLDVRCSIAVPHWIASVALRSIPGASRRAVSCVE